MSYSYELADRALTQFRAQEPWIAEEILDELELLATTDLSTIRKSSAGFVHDFVRPHKGGKFYVFLTIVADHRNRLLQVANIGIYIRPGAPNG